jgi:hypothetical protein
LKKRRGRRSPEGTLDSIPAEAPFPITEAFGFASSAQTPESQQARARKWCPFAQAACEKYRQYRFGYCSVTYAAADDSGVRRTYAVCDHRLDGAPVRSALADYFPSLQDVRLVAEVVLAKPRASFDYVAFQYTGDEIKDAIVIETQSIDMRGGGVGPAWHAWMEGHPERWREYFSAEAARKGRQDKVAYGVNMANIYKRLGLQVAEKGGFLKHIGVRLYVVMQDRPFRYLRSRIAFQEVTEGWDITFMTFDYTGQQNADGSLAFTHMQTVRTTLESYQAALSADTREGSDRAHFIERVKKKAGLP